jgi:predicted Zn-dependent protease
MTDIVTSLFESSLERYQAGESPETLIPVFKDICDRAPKNATGWACLAWLYLLVNKPKSALKAAQKSVKLEPRAPQGRINLVLAMLETGEKGVRPHIEVAQQIMGIDQKIRQDVVENLEDGLTRKPDWENLQRVKSWLLND